MPSDDNAATAIGAKNGVIPRVGKPFIVGSDSSGVTVLGRSEGWIEALRQCSLNPASDTRATRGRACGASQPCPWRILTVECILHRSLFRKSIDERNTRPRRFGPR